MADPVYEDRIRELDEASSPTHQILLQQSPPGQQPQPGQGGEGGQPQLTPETVKGMLRGFGPPSSADMRETATQEYGQSQEQKPKPSKETEAVLAKPEWRKALDTALKTMTGHTSEDIQKAIEEGTLNKLVVPMTLKSADPFGNAAGAISEDTARKSGLDPQAVQQISGATAFFAGLLMPGFKGSKAGQEISAAATAARAAGATEAAAAKAKRLIRISEITGTEARALTDQGGLAVGRRQIKIDYAAVDSTGDLNQILNKAAEVVHDEFVAAKRGVIHDSNLARTAQQNGIDIVELLARKPGEIFTVEKQFAAQMVAGDLGLKLKQMAKQYNTAPTPALEDEMRRVGALLLTVVPQMRASTSEAARVTRIAGVSMPGVKEAKRQTDLLDLMAKRGQDIAKGMPMREIAKQLDTLDEPEQVLSYFKVLRGLLGGIVGAGLGAEGGEAVGGTPGAVAGGIAGGALGAAGAINPGVFMEAWINGLLSGQLTYVVNVTTEMASTVNGMIERALAASHGGIAAAESGKVVHGEAMVMLHAGVTTMWRDFLAYAKILAKEPGWTAARAATGAAVGAAVSTDESLPGNVALGAAVGAVVRPSSFLINDMELTQRALSAEGLGLSGPLGRVADVTGAYLRAPSRGLVQADNWIKSLNIEMQMWALAHREAILSGAKVGSAGYREVVTKAMMEPSGQTLANAHDYAAYIAFQSETNRQVAGIGAGNPIFRIIAPFTFTPTNILSMSFERMPLVQYASQTLREDLKAGGAREQLARAKIDMGIALTGFSWYLAAAGVTHGAGSMNPQINKIEREILHIPKYSITVPGTDKHVVFNRFDPWAMHFGMVASIYEMSSELPDATWQQLLGAVVVAGAEQWLDKSYLQGVSQFTDALTEMQKGNFREWDKFVQGLAASTVPSGVANLERTLDPSMRQVDSVLDAVKGRLPSISEDVPPRRDFFAKPVPAPHVGMEVFDALNPFYIYETTSDAKELYIGKELKAKRIAVSGPSRLIGPGTSQQSVELEPEIGVHSIRLSDEQYDRLTKSFGNGVTVGGKKLKDGLYDAMHSSTYKSLGPLGQANYIKAIVSQYKFEARQELLLHDRALKAKVDALNRQQMDKTMRPQPAKQPGGDLIQNLMKSFGG